MKRIITCILAITFLYALFYAPIYIPNREFDGDITSARLLGGHDKEYLTDDEIRLVEKWLPSLLPYMPSAVVDGDAPASDFVNLRAETEDNYLVLTIPALYRNDVPDFAIPIMVSGHHLPDTSRKITP